ncbi:heparan-alpha-glucosaminide N-acetyltransferase domain-containing protein [Geodermatophilus sp. CPCC 205506]|uniref:heparan-alpha-glucosaminide N-acetyltransferase domain-containing protein n=1 Tax=Geodermatophilus sp. CPCC 205506 TaxID=2936596 RepID=UPI003F52DD12
MSTAVRRDQARQLPSAQQKRRLRSDRVAGLDVARALAVFGMFGAHVGVVADDVGSSPSTWLGVVNGRSSILFAVLAGVSVALLSGRTVPAGGDELVRARMRILVRAAWVFAIGGVLEALGTDIDIILGVYAVLFVLALPFLRWPPRQLLVAAGVLAVVTPPVDLVLAQLAEATGSYDTPFVWLAVTGPYPALIWWAFLLVGLAVGRSDLASARARATLVATGAGLAVLGYGGGWVTTQWFAGGTPVDGDGFSERPDAWDPVWLTGSVPHSGTTFEIVGSVGFALIVIGVCLVVAELLPRVSYPLASVGAMALTVYTGQVVAVWLIGTLDYDDNGAWATYILVSLVVATAWRVLLGRGPLERLLTWNSTLAAGRANRCAARDPAPSAS